ncbi:FAD-dependent oxidoreductase [Alcaligenaceae bacterium CGII-47]|nr:FAD-dependent oxidoreductase [Alcaligenaceae bacterium CGII-47]
MDAEHKTKDRNAHVIVAGAGIIGVCTALALQRDGLRVTLVDREAPGMGCSYGNAGLLHAGGCIPLATPDSLKKLPSMLMDPEGALRIAWRHLPALSPWLLRMAAQARPDRVAHNIRALHALLKPARHLYDKLFRQTGLQHLIRSGGELHLYRHQASMQAAQWGMGVLREKGITVQDLDAASIRELEPALDKAFQHAHFLPDSDMITSPHQLTQGLANYFAQQGGTVLRGEIRSVRPNPSGGTDLQVDGQTLHASSLVLSTGAWSGQLTQQLGVRVPLQSWRGYHIMLPRGDLSLRRVVVDSDHHVAVSPMVDGLRVIGYLEFAGLKAPADSRRSHSLLKSAQRLIPDISGQITSAWMGHRPGTPDSLPVIGPLPGHPSVYCAFGHGQLGLTLGATTGQMIADLVAGRQGAIDPTPYRVNRF